MNEWRAVVDHNASPDNVAAPDLPGSGEHVSPVWRGNGGTGSSDGGNRDGTGLMAAGIGGGRGPAEQEQTVQRKDIDEVGFAILETELDGKQVMPGDIAVVTGHHPRHGQVVLVQAGGLYLALADDVGEIIGRDDPIEKEG